MLSKTPPSLNFSSHFFQHLHQIILVFTLLTSAYLVTGCGSGDDVVNNYYGVTPGGGGTDTDGDGLTDEEEALIGTSIRLKDSDGDGFDDFKEVIEYGFNPENNNFRFNPLIADLPKIRVDITSIPVVNLIYENSTAQSVTLGVDRTTETASTVTTSDTSSNSKTVEETHTAGVEVGYEAGILGGFSGSVSYDYSHSTTNESSFSHTKEQSEENRQALTESESVAKENGYLEKGGEIRIGVRVQNDGDVSFKLSNLVLGSVMIDNLNRAKILPIANLSIDTPTGDFAGVTLAPDGSTSDLVFKNDTLNIDAAKTILRDASGLIVNVASSEVVDADGVGFAFRETDVVAKTATVIVDYGGKLPSERYRVATNVDLESGRVSLLDVMTSILHLPYTIKENGSLDSVRGIVSDTATSSYWVGVLVSDNGVEASSMTLNPDSDYDFNALSLKSGDILQLTFMEDADGDGVGIRREFFAGTSPELDDTDGDGLTDGQELQGFDLTIDYGDGAGPVTRKIRSNPLLVDTDGDGVNDSLELNSTTLTWITDPNYADSDGDGIIDSIDPSPTQFATIDVTGESISAVQLSLATSNVQIGFTVAPLAGATLTYEIIRDQAALDADIVKSSTTVLYSGNNAANNAVPLPVSITDTVANDMQYMYSIYLTLEGGTRILMKELVIDTAIAKQSLTVEVLGLSVSTCIDIFPLLDADFTTPPDVECELFWTVSINGQIVSQRLEIDKAKVVTGSNVALNESLTFEVPDQPTQCFNMDITLYESDSSSAYSNSGDHLLTTIRYLGSGQHCAFESPAWGENTVLNPRSVTSIYARSGTTFPDNNAEEILVNVNYTVTVNP